MKRHLLAAIAAQAAASGYPLNDDGTLAGSFGFGWMATNAPDYLRADYTYSGAATGGTALAMPAAANWLTSQAIIVGAGKILAIEAEVISVSASPFALLGLAAALSTGGVFGGTLITNGIDNDAGNPQWRGTGISNQVRSGATAGFLVGFELNGNDGSITLRSTDGSLVSSTTFTPGVAFTPYLFTTDGGIPAASATMSVRLKKSGADYALPFTAGAVDLLGNVLP